MVLAVLSNFIKVFFQTTAPNKEPTAAVMPMASAPQKVTRPAPASTGAPPARAANAPNTAKKRSEAADTQTIRSCAGAIAVTASGSAAPTAKLAEIGRAHV